MMYALLFSPAAERYFKKLKDKRLLAKFKESLLRIKEDPYIGQVKHGDLSGIYGYDVYYDNTATGAERSRLLKQQDKLSEPAREIGTFEEKVHHLADQNISIDLDDGVKKNYEIFADVLAKMG